MCKVELRGSGIACSAPRPQCDETVAVAKIQSYSKENTLSSAKYIMIVSSKSLKAGEDCM
jgi:hypothetical protein